MSAFSNKTKTDWWQNMYVSYKNLKIVGMNKMNHYSTMCYYITD